MGNKNNIFKLSNEQYQKKYRNRREHLLIVTKKQVEEFDRVHKQENNYLLKGRKWALIDDKYYEIPKAPRFTWFRNLNAGAQVGLCVLSAGVLATAVGVPAYLLTRPATEIVIDIEGKTEEQISEEVTKAIDDPNIKKVTMSKATNVVIDMSKKKESEKDCAMKIDKQFTFEGNGSTIKLKADENTTNRHVHTSVLNITAKNTEVTFKDVNVSGVGLTSDEYYETIRIENAFGSTINFDNVKNIIDDDFEYYGLYVLNDNEDQNSLSKTGVNINFNNGSLIGYSATKLNGNYINFSAENTKFTGFNKNSLVPGSSNACDAIQIQYPFYAGGRNDDPLNCNNSINLNKCEIKCDYNPATNERECAVDCLSPLHNSIVITDTTFDTPEECTYGTNCYQYVSTIEDDVVDLIDTAVLGRCSTMKDEKFKDIKTHDELLFSESSPCRPIDYITVDNVKYGYNQDEGKEYTIDKRYKVGEIEDSEEANTIYPNYPISSTGRRR